jgi:DNA repair protein RecN (Recombination protein N)
VLTHLHIRNLAVLDEVEIELRPGFTALTGETGAGKSMLVDALALALGERADSSAVRTGAERAEVTATFDLSARQDLQAWLRDHDLDTASECSLRRVLTQEGRSRGYVNGQPVAIEVLRQIGEQLVEICGQHAHQSLRHRSAHRAIVDSHGQHGGLLAACATAHAQWSQLEAEYRSLATGSEAAEARRELLEHQLRELQALALQPGEWDAVEREHRLLANRGRAAEALQRALDLLYDAEPAARDLMAGASRELAAVADLDAGLRPACDALDQAAIQLGEAVALARSRLDGLEHDPEREAEIESRHEGALDLARKHRVDPEDLPLLTTRLAAEHGRLAGAGPRLGELEGEVRDARARLDAAAKMLTEARTRAARSLADAVTKNLRRLGMKDARFLAGVEPAAGATPGPDGADQVEFLVSMNPGQAPGPIGRVASGGELSRVSLAIQVVALARQSAGTLIFDEVDAGVGGGVAEIVGLCLQTLSADRQVLCVTHLPQVASQANHHIVVRKSSTRQATRTTLAPLSGDDRVEEIARMLGGVSITERTRAHANEMLRSARGSP